jgi:hypothetical protein
MGPGYLNPAPFILLDNVSFPGETLIISVEGENARFARKLRRVALSRIL